MTAVADRPLRADAARNAERILRAARDVVRRIGPDAPMDAIASRAGVGERTLYRRFPTKGELARAVIDQSIAETLSPVIERATPQPEPAAGPDRSHRGGDRARRPRAQRVGGRAEGGALTDVSVQLDAALDDLTRRAQEAGLVRADLVAEDLPRIVAMLNSVLATMDPASDGWRRYVAADDRRDIHLAPRRCRAQSPSSTNRAPRSGRADERIAIRRSGSRCHRRGPGARQAVRAPARERGARVVVNDLGGSVTGDGAGGNPANDTAQEIKDNGGEAVADTNSVATPEGGQAIIDTAVDTWGRVDILVNNAGTVSDADSRT